ncbi:MAG: carboxypeptidase-like regulatory domain-containing protein [Sphingobacteriaceae bacterium]|nr:carboxypeptidase-like regulatory domain-containing protein [Sphingobacteriaceae bacterium]
MLKRFLLNFILLICLCSSAIAQNTFSISGTVKDNVGVLPGASIYLSGYKISTVTNDAGNFTLPKLAPGSYDILVQMIGFLPFKKNIILEKSVSINVVLIENTTLLNEVVVKPDPDRAYHLSLFRDNFIGLSPNAEDCKLLNPQVLTTHFDKSTSILTISTDQFLIIENKSLGYKIKYLLENFEYNFKTRIIYYAGQPFFEDLKGGSAKQKKWAKAREIAFNGSIQHFFKSLYENKVSEEGFVINKLIKIPNPMRKSDSLINANIKKFTGVGQVGRTITLNISDSLNYWFRQKNEPKLVNTINRANVIIDTLVKPFNENLKAVAYNDALYIMYKNELETAIYRNSGHWQSRPLDMPNYQISVIHLLSSPAAFFANGGILDPKSFLYEGYWAYEKIADMVPMDYIRPTKKM